MQSLAIYQKRKQKEKVKKGKALFQSMTRKEDDIDVTNFQTEIKAPRRKPAIMPIPAPQTPDVLSYDMAIRNENALPLIFPVENTENSQADLVPFEPNFNQNDISDLDMLSAICGVNENTTTTVSNTSNILTNMPHAMFANCQVGSINITVSKK